ncbi:primosome assembly protein PriA, partial [Mycobacterium tuberculosis]|nr:primosome assembly protein PriA [Mycobacterium tuberculosis]
MSPSARTPVEVEPIARVLPMLSVPHLDREFDYLVSAEQSDDAQPGVRVRVRFHGRLVDGFVLERRADTDHPGKLGWLDRVVSAEPVLTPEIRRLVDAVAARYAGTRPDVLRLAVPARHARV